MDEWQNHHPVIHFERITARTVLQICKLSETLTASQRNMVTDNAVSIAQAHFSENAWFRAVYADDTPIGFIMLHTGSDPASSLGLRCRAGDVTGQDPLTSGAEHVYSNGVIHSPARQYPSGELVI